MDVSDRRRLCSGCSSNCSGCGDGLCCNGSVFSSSTASTSNVSSVPSLSSSSVFSSSGAVQQFILRLVVGAISGGLTCFFALVGAFIGAITGALAGRVSNSSVLRGSVLGAVAGSILSIEVLEAARFYWCSERPEAQNSLSMAEFIADLLHGCFIQEQFAPTTFPAYRWQIGITAFNQDEMYDIFGEGASKGLSGESLKKLPSHVLDGKRDDRGDGISCTICFQDIEIGETVRSLPPCSHTFHLSCVDKWLLVHGSCPVCRSKLQDFI